MGVVRLFNGGPDPVVPDGRWGEGVVLPGQFIEVDEADAARYSDPPWTRDSEAEQALTRLGPLVAPWGAGPADLSTFTVVPAEAVRGPENAPQGVSDGNPPADEQAQPTQEV